MNRWDILKNKNRLTKKIYWEKKNFIEASFCRQVDTMDQIRAIFNCYFLVVILEGGERDLYIGCHFVEHLAASGGEAAGGTIYDCA